MTDSPLAEDDGTSVVSGRDVWELLLDVVNTSVSEDGTGVVSDKVA